MAEVVGYEDPDCDKEDDGRHGHPIFELESVGCFVVDFPLDGVVDAPHMGYGFLIRWVRINTLGVFRRWQTELCASSVSSVALCVLASSNVDVNCCSVRKCEDPKLDCLPDIV